MQYREGREGHFSPGAVGFHWPKLRKDRLIFQHVGKSYRRRLIQSGNPAPKFSADHLAKQIQLIEKQAVSKQPSLGTDLALHGAGGSWFVGSFAEMFQEVDGSEGGMGGARKKGCGWLAIAAACLFVAAVGTGCIAEFGDEGGGGTVAPPTGPTPTRLPISPSGITLSKSGKYHHAGGLASATTGQSARSDKHEMRDAELERGKNLLTDAVEKELAVTR